MIRFNMTEVERLSSDVTKLSASVRDVTPILKLLALLGVRAVQRNFDTSTAPDGSAWKPLKNPRGGGRLWLSPGRFGGHTVHREGGRSDKPLIDTAAMRNGINSDVSGPSTVRIGASNLTKSRNAIHNFGGQAGRNHKVTIPKREYMGFSAAARREMVENVRAQVVRLLRTGH